MQLSPRRASASSIGAAMAAMSFVAHAASAPPAGAPDVAPDSASEGAPTQSVVAAEPRVHPTEPVADAKPSMVVAAPPSQSVAVAQSPSLDDLLRAAEAPPPPEQDEEEEFDLPCVVVSHPGCGTQAHLEVGMGWGESSSYVGTQWSYRGFLDAGVLFGLAPDVQLGPTAELGFDVGRVNSGYTLSTKLRARYWIGGWYVSLDGAAGAAFEHFTFDGGTENGTREGVVAELGLSVLGVVGPYVACYALGDGGGRGSHEERWIVGFRGNLASWVAGIAAAFANSGAPIIL